MRGYAAVALHNPKHLANVGAALRACHCFRSSLMIISGIRPKRYMGKHISTDTPRTYKHMPVICSEDLKSSIPYDCVPVAVELLERAKPLKNYVHPERALYIFGAEDATLGKQVLDFCRDIVYIPTNHCMNLAATVNVVLYDRMIKSETNN